MFVSTFNIYVCVCGYITHPQKKNKNHSHTHTHTYTIIKKKNQGLILNNYAEQDILAKLCRLAIGASIVFGYPLTFVGIRDGVLNLLGNKNPSDKTQTVTTLILLTIVSTLAVFLRDVGFVVSFGGALLGSCIIYIFPALIFLKTMSKKIAAGEVSKEEMGGVKREMLVNKGITGLGVVMALIGASVSVLKTFILKK